MLKWIGSPSPHQNQSKRWHSMVRLENTTSLHDAAVEHHEGEAAIGVGNDAVVDGHVADGVAMLPSQNLMALEDDDSRQLVTVMFSHGSAGPHQFVE